MDITGIPEKGLKRPIPFATNTVWDYVVQQHDAEKAGLHYDFRLSDGNVAYSWASRYGLPSLGSKRLFVRQSDHAPEYMKFSGTIEKGYGKGTVRVIDSGKAEIIKASPDKIMFNIYRGWKNERYLLIKTSEDNWLCSNITPTEENRPDIPSKKIRFKSIEIDKINLKKRTQLLTPKIDGSAATFYLQANKPIEIYSYRRSKRGPELIDYTWKYPELSKIIVPPDIKKAVLWGEVYGVKNKSAVPLNELGGILNSNTFKARQALKDHNIKLRNIIYNVEVLNNKNMADAPYKDKIKALQFINSKIPQLKLPRIAKTTNQKKRLIDEVVNKKNPLTQEGFVLWDLNQPTPIKIKLRKDTEVYAQGFEKGKGKHSKRLGVILATEDPEGRGPLLRVGTGFSDAEREHIWKHRKQYLKKPLTIYYQEKLPSGRYRMPVFKAWRTTEFWPT